MKKIIINENFNKTYTMYTGISKDVYETIWKNKNLKDKLTNVTTDIDFALDYSYDFKTGKYENLVLEISNIPLEAFIAYREDEYGDDDDFNSMNNLTTTQKVSILNTYSLFIVDLYNHKDLIKIDLIDKN